MSALPSEADARTEYPMADGLLFYFPAALAGVARCSKIGNEQHNKGEPLHWAMDKSTDHANKILRHLMDVGTDDSDGIPHSVKVAWRALALAQEDLMERHGAPMPRNGRKGESPLIHLARVFRETPPPVGCAFDAEWAVANSSVIDKESYSRQPNCDAFERYGATHSKRDALDRFARDNESTGA